MVAVTAWYLCLGDVKVNIPCWTYLRLWIACDTVDSVPCAVTVVQDVLECSTPDGLIHNHCRGSPAVTQTKCQSGTAWVYCVHKSVRAPAERSR